MVNDQDESLLGDSETARDYWQSKYRNGYHRELDQLREVGRCGVIAELIVRLVPAGRVLDAGCGSGLLARLLPQQYQYLGIDIAPAAIEQARLVAGDRARFRVCSIGGFEPQHPLQVLVFNEVIYHMPLEVTLERARSWLVDDGLVVTSIYHFPRGLRFLARLHERLDVVSELHLHNAAHDLHWTVCAGRLRAMDQQPEPGSCR